MTKVWRKIIEIDEELCNGCGQCVLACQEGAIALVEGKAKLVSEVLCDGFGACVGECPTGALKIIEREAEPFNEQAVEVHLKKILKEVQKEAESFHHLPCGCPSHQIKEFERSHTAPTSQNISSALTHWPVQIRLIPTSAPFLREAKLLVCADCVAVAYPGLHTELLPERKIMLGCPKFDPAELYIEKFAEIFAKVPLQSVEVAIMEVPCCKGLVYILNEARKLANLDKSFKVYTIGVRGELLKEEEI